MSAAMFIRDADPERRRRGIASAESAMRRFDLEVSSVEDGEIGIIWGGYSGAPVNQAPGAFLMGDVIPGPGPERLTAREYGERCRGADVPPAFDGYHLAATFDAHGALRVAVDILGSFPLYWAMAGDALLVASSPALITAHPAFDAAPDPLGIAALLVANGALRGRTPYRGIRRLAAGHALVAAPGAPPREVEQFRLPFNEDSFDVPATECALRLHEALSEAARRHVPHGVPHTMLLSGGLDSRVITGTLVQQGVAVEAITRGIPTDLDYRCAHAVARHLGIPHRLVPHGAGGFEDFERTIWWDGLSAAPGTGGDDGLGSTVAGARPHIVSGYLGDAILGCGRTGVSFDRVTRRASVDHYISRINAWGVPLDRLPGLLRRDVFGDAVETLLVEVREDFVGCADTFMRRTWRYDFAHRQRFVMGRMFARLAFGGWPRAPQVDRALLRVVCGMPTPLTSGRRLERAVLERFHTDLARLPLDRNDPDTTPPLPDVRALLRAGFDRRVRRVREQFGIPRADRRYYHRTFDFNGEGWRVARRGAERDRERVHALFDPEAFDALVPPADSAWQPTGRIEGAGAAKMLTALAVWLRVAFP